MVGEKITARLKAIPENAITALNEFKEQSAISAIIGAAERFGRANRELIFGS